MRSIIIWSRRSVAARDPHSGDTRVGKDDARERKTSVARRGCNKAAVNQASVGAETLDARAGLTVPFLSPGLLPSGKSTSVKIAAKPLTFAAIAPLVPGMGLCLRSCLKSCSSKRCDGISHICRRDKRDGWLVWETLKSVKHWPCFIASPPILGRLLHWRKRSGLPAPCWRRDFAGICTAVTAFHGLCGYNKWRTELFGGFLHGG